MKNFWALQRSLTIAKPMSRESRIEFLFELLSCWLLAVGTALMQNVQLAYPVSYFAVLWQTAVTVIILALFSRRWFILLITSVQLLILGFLAMLLFGVHIGEFFTTIGDFFVWWFAGMPKDSPLFTEGGMMAVHVLLNIGIGCLLFFVVRLSRSAVPPLVLCITIFVAIMAFGDTTNNTLAMAAYLAGGFPLIAREQYSGRRLFSGTEKYTPMGNRWGLSTTAGTVCILSAAVLLLTMPMNTVDWRTRKASILIADFQTWANWFTNEQRELKSPSLSSLGLQKFETRLGGDLQKQESNVLAVTNGTASSLLRVTTYDTYTGTLWENSFDIPYRVNGPWEEEQVSLLNGAVQTDPRREKDMLPLTRKRQLTVTLQKDAQFLPGLSQITGYTELTETKNPVLFNRHGELFSFFGLPAGYSYTLDVVTFPVTDIPNDETFKTLGNISETGVDEFYDNSENLEVYLDLPEGYSYEAENMAYKIAGQYTDPLKQAVTLSQYFTQKRGYKYTDMPGDTKVGEDVVTKLMSTKKGHSVYYATTVATMARSLGIPSRLAAGYRTVWNEEYQAYVVDTASPYAWVECYIRRLGWIALDATPRSQSASVTQTPSDGLTEPPPLVNPDEPPPSEQAPPKEVLKPISPSSYWIFPLILLVLWLLRTLLAARAYRPSVARRLFPDCRRRCLFYYHDILRQLSLCGRPIQPEETLLEWLAELEVAMGAAPIEALRPILQPVLAMEYGRRTPTEEDIAALVSLHQQLESTLRQRMRLPLYWLRRRVLLRVYSFALLRPMAKQGRHTDGDTDDMKG